MNKFWKNLAFVILLVLLAAFIVQALDINGGKPVKDITFPQFVESVKGNDIASATVNATLGTVEGKFTSSAGRFSSEQFKVTYSEDFNISQFLLNNKVAFTVDREGPTPWWLSLIAGAFPFLLIILFWFFMMQQMQGGGNKVMQFGKSRAKKTLKDEPKTTFADVAGVDEAVQELEEIKEFLENPQKFQALGAKIPRGLLLYGPPGTGKTLLARAVAGEAGVPFFSISGSDFVEMFVGVGASRVRDLFEQAKTNAPCIIFMDEIDAVGRQRGAGLGGGHDEREQTLNQLLVEMDGFDTKDGIIMIAATNRPDILDPALLRPGRFDRQIVIDLPDLVGRKNILKVHTKDKPLGKETSLDVLARRTPGFTGADLANMVNEAALLAARNGKNVVQMDELEEAIDRVVAGPEKKTRLISEREKETIAYHESGHALIAYVLPDTDPVHKISIIPRGQAMGYTLTLPTEDRYLVSKNELVDKLAVLLGGRVAEKLVFNDITSGAHNDLEKATKMARQMVCEFGMSDSLGPMTRGQRQDQVFLGRDFSAQQDYSQEIAWEIDKEMHKFIDEAYADSMDILSRNKEVLHMIANTLIEKETLDKGEVEALLKNTTLDKEKNKRAQEKDKIIVQMGRKRKGKTISTPVALADTEAEPRSSDKLDEES